MDIQSLELFSMVASLGSFAAAARERDLDPSSISRIIGGLEEELGVRLFHRTTRTLSLTEAGERYLVRIEPTLKELRQAQEEIRYGDGQPAGALRITSSTAFAEKCLMPLLPEFLSAYPGLKPEFILNDENLDLVANRIDLAVRLGERVHGDYVVSRCRPTRYRVCASPAYLTRHPNLTMPEDLAQHECLVFTLPDFRFSWVFRNAEKAVLEVRITAGIAISNALALRQATIQGLGPALLADWLVEKDLESGMLVDVFPEFEAAASSFDTAVWFVYPSKNYLPHKVRVTIDFLRKKLSRK